jgi:hypothetical protein
VEKPVNAHLPHEGGQENRSNAAKTESFWEGQNIDR